MRKVIFKPSQRRIRIFYKQGFSISELAIMYNTSTPIVQRIIK